MGTLTFEVKEFIEDNIDLIEDRAWDQIYDNARFTLDSESTGGFTLAMLDIGEDPLKTLDYIPDYYLSDAKIEYFNIPNHIHLLSEGCFAYSSLKEIVIPESVITIEMYSFSDCSQLKRVVIPPSVQNIAGNSFYPFDGVIVCKEGSAAETYAIACDIEVEYY